MQQEEQHIEGIHTDMNTHTHCLCLSESSLSLTEGQWCVKLRCAACDSINEWIALSIEGVCACICVCLSLKYGGINTPFNPLLWITQYYRWLRINVCVCVRVRGRECRGEGGCEQIPLIQQQATVWYIIQLKMSLGGERREGWGERRGSRQKSGADRDEARRYETNLEEKKKIWEGEIKEGRMSG